MVCRAPVVMSAQQTHVQGVNLPADNSHFALSSIIVNVEKIGLRLFFGDNNVGTNISYCKTILHNHKHDISNKITSCALISSWPGLQGRGSNSRDEDKLTNMTGSQWATSISHADGKHIAQQSTVDDSWGRRRREKELSWGWDNKGGATADATVWTLLLHKINFKPTLCPPWSRKRTTACSACLGWLPTFA